MLEQALQMVRHYFCCLSGGQLSAEEVAAFTSVFEVSYVGFRVYDMLPKPAARTSLCVCAPAHRVDAASGV